MKTPVGRTKVVIRRLPPAILPAAVAEHVDGRFAGRYNWFCLRPGDTRLKNQRFSRAYINFNRPEDVVEFAEIFNGHIFVNEKGAQYKAIVEYAPSQHVPKACSEKDACEGTISNDPEYLEFIDVIANPVENLPNAEIQLERKEAEKAAGQKGAIVVTPLMEYVRQKRAAKAGLQRPTNGKPNRRAGGSSPSRFSTSRRSSEKRRNSTPVYVLKNSMKDGTGKDRSAYVLVSRRDEQQHVNKSISVSINGKGTSEEAASGGAQNGKKRVLLLKPSENESSQDRQHEAKDSCTTQLHTTPSPKLQTKLMNLDKNNCPPCPPNPRLLLKGHPVKHSTETDAKGPSEYRSLRNDIHGSSLGKKLDKCTRTKERVDRVWAPLHRLDDGKPSKRGGLGIHGIHERKVWVQKSSSGS